MLQGSLQEDLGEVASRNAYGHEIAVGNMADNSQPASCIARGLAHGFSPRYDVGLADKTETADATERSLPRPPQTVA